MRNTIQHLSNGDFEVMPLPINHAEFINIGENVILHERGRELTGICIADGGDGKQFWFSVAGTGRKVLAIVVDDEWVVLQGKAN